MHPPTSHIRRHQVCAISPGIPYAGSLQIKQAITVWLVKIKSCIAMQHLLISDPHDPSSEHQSPEPLEIQL